ncbi:hypothetical protein [Haladaptatus sp. DFWS20]|uniref:hypothetical protein n=1 Tax=Haladaptatus sp. DFWS20 TaxID=3403467 RepID=UPI003EB96C19
MKDVVENGSQRSLADPVIRTGAVVETMRMERAGTKYGRKLLNAMTADVESVESPEMN